MNCIKLSSDQQHRRRLVAVDSRDCRAPGHASSNLLGNVADTLWVEVGIVGCTLQEGLHAEKQGLVARAQQESNSGIHLVVVWRGRVGASCILHIHWVVQEGKGGMGN